MDGVAVSDKWLMWCGSELCEERRQDEPLPISRVFRHGATTTDGNRYYVRDHLGSVIDVMNGASAAVEVFDYDPWGRRRQLYGSAETTIGFTGHYFHSASGLHLTARRAYEAELGRWISQDPSISALALPEGPNLYAYVGNKPTGFLDPTGQSAVGAGGIGVGVAVIFTGVCVKIVENTWRQFQNPYEGTIDPSQRLKHCVVECEITKNCIGGSATAAAAGWLNEQFGDHDEGDRDAGRQGRQAAKSCPQKTCFLQCEELLKQGSLYK
jgi:RHS repeat-associated protein